jgi:hypothetical protein
MLKLKGFQVDDPTRAPSGRRPALAAAFNHPLSDRWFDGHRKAS